MFSRRQFISHSLLGSGLFLFPKFAKSAEENIRLIKPKALSPGDTVGLVTPASALFEAERTLIEATEKMEALGFKVKIAENVFKKKGYLAGPVKDRVDDLHAMFADDAVRAIIAIRGGYGSGQLLPHLDYDLIRRNPKILLGYSDITSLLIGIHRQTGLVTFHGPVAISTFTDYTKKYFFKTLTKTEPVGEIEDAPYEKNLQQSSRIWSYRGGESTGKLTGGNLTLLQATIGTPYEFDASGAILFIEEVGEEPYDLDRMLNHLKQAGKFDNCRGVLFDQMDRVEPPAYRPAFNNTLSVEEVIDDVFRDYDFPVCVGFSIGHIKDKPTLPLGIKVKFDGKRGKLSLLESAVSE